MSGGGWFRADAVLTDVAGDLGSFRFLCAPFLGTLSSSCLISRWELDLQAPWLWSVSWEWPFSTGKQKLSQKRPSAAWLLLTSHWPELDHKTPASWNVARKRRAEGWIGSQQHLIHLWGSHLSSLPGAHQMLGVTPEPADGVSHAVSLLPCTAHLSA